MLWEMRITATPSLLSRRIRSSTRADSRSPSAAVGSSRITSFDEKATARATATAWRCPPDINATGASKSGRVICRRSTSSRVRSDIARRAQEAARPWQPTRTGEFTPGEEVRGRCQIVEQRQVLVHGLDPASSGAGGGGVGDVDPVERDPCPSRADGHR